MLSGISASPGVTSFSSSGVERAGISPFLYHERDDAPPPFVSRGSLEGVGPFSSNAENGLDFAVVGAFGPPAVDVLLVPVLDMVQKQGLETSRCFSFGDEEGVTHSRACLTGILILLVCLEDEYCRPRRRRCDRELLLYSRLLGRQGF